MGEMITLATAMLGSTAISAPLGVWLGSVLTRDRYRTEIEQLRADVQDKLANVKSTELDNVRKANDLLVESIVTPLKTEIKSLRRDVEKFRKAIERIPSCPESDTCPVSLQLQKYEDDRANRGDTDK